MSHVYCPECGFQNPEAANYCARCGALLVEDDAAAETTMTFTPEESEDETATALEELGIERPALVVRSGGGRAGETFPPERRAHDDRPLAGLRHLPRRRHRLAAARRARRGATAASRSRTRAASTARSSTAAGSSRRELADGDELQIGKYRLTFLRDEHRDDPHDDGSAAQRLLTIGAVCRRLKAEFPDISISKIRYLEDQGLLAPRRTQGGYRLFGEEDVERLQTILELQRDEFLPLRVIRQELASPSATERKRRSGRAARAGGRGRPRRALRARRDHRPTWPASSRSSGCSTPRVEARREALSARPTSTSRPPAAGSPPTGSRRGTCARSGPPPTARPGCSRQSSRRRCARGTPSAGRRRCEDLQTLAEPRPGARTAPALARARGRQIATDGATDRPAREDPRRPGLPEAGDRLQGHHAAARRRRRAARDGRPAGRVGRAAASPTSSSAPRRAASSPAARSRAGSAAGFVAARKPGKLPWRTVSAKYALEYGFDALELHADAITPGQRVLVPRRRARDGRDGEGEVRARRAARRRRRRRRVHHRARRS